MRLPGCPSEPIIAKLEWNENGYNEFMAIINFYSCPSKFLIEINL